MEQSIDDRVAQAMAHLKATEASVSEAEAELSQASASARSADRSVQVTVGPKGELTALEFLDGKYKNMAAAQLSTAVLGATFKARSEMAQRVVELLEPLIKRTSEGAMAQSLGVDWAKVFGNLVTETRDQPRLTAMSRLRDEIHEDGAGA